ncbi:TPA: hypothetical protein EYP26_05290 [Candidatus Bathyarchaeota archaeon]|nr:hypothetical protein [Candidatus Bathyarchaeota archaeon]
MLVLALIVYAAIVAKMSTLNKAVLLTGETSFGDFKTSLAWNILAGNERIRTGNSSNRSSVACKPYRMP